MASRVTLISSQEYQVMPWKNGGGVSTELAIYPKKSNFSESFDWRISLALIKGSGPFSTFSGYDRVIIQFKGNPMQLNHLNQPSHQLRPLVPYYFQGDWITEGVLQGGEAQDFNVMTKRSRYQSSVECLSMKSDCKEIHPRGDFCFVWAMQGEIRLKVEQQEFALSHQASLLIEKASQAKIQVDGAAGTLFIVHLTLDINAIAR